MLVDLPQCVGPSIFWFWNEDPTRDSIARRLDDFLDRGFGSVHVHPMPNNFRPHDFHGGMRIDYLSPAFFELIAITCDLMRQREMVLWLYDEGGWPSGRAGGLLVQEDKSYGAWGLSKQLGQISPINYAQECDYPDLMNSKATQRFIELTHERYREAIGDEFGKTVKGIFTDEPRILGQVGTDTIPWSPTLPEAFEIQYGYPLDRIIDLLFEVDTIDEATHRARRDYLRTLSAQIGRCYFDPIRAWCDRNHLLFEGHHTGDDDFARHGQYFGHYLEQANRYHLPGVDAIWRQVFPGQQFGNFVSLAATRAWLNGSRVAMSEVFAAYGQGLTLGQMRWISCHHLIRGVNRLILMASLESSRGSRRLGTCIDFSPSDLRWRDLDLFIQHIERAARFTLRGTPITSVAMYYRSEQLEGGDATDFNQQHERITEAILDKFHPLLFAGENDLARVAAMGVDDLIVYAAALLDASESRALDDAQAAGMNIQHVALAAPARVPDSPLIEPLMTTRGVRALPLRRDDSGVDLMLFNQNDEEMNLRFRWHGPPMTEHPLDDDPTLDLRPLRWMDGVCSVTLLPGELRAWTECDAWDDAPQWTLRHMHPLTEGWTVRITERMTITDQAVLKSVDEPTREIRLESDAALNPISGTLVYEHRIESKIDTACRYILNLTSVFDACEVLMNDRTIARRAWSPWCADLTQALHRGMRELSVRVTNTAASAWLDSSVHERDLREWPNPYLRTAAPFMAESRHAQLVGPAHVLAFDQ